MRAASLDAALLEPVRAATLVLPTWLSALAESSSWSQVLTGCTSASPPTRSSSGGPSSAGEGDFTRLQRSNAQTLR